MGIFDRMFIGKTNDKLEDESLPSYWEDDYCQIEIVPRKNIERIRQSVQQIEEFTEKTRTESGFTDIFVRNGLPFPTINEELRIDAFGVLLSQKGLNKAKQIRYDAYRIIDCSNSTSNAYFLPNFSIFYDCQDEFIKNIWISISPISSDKNYKIILETLYELGECYELVLIDWNSSELIDLANKRQIESYLMSYTN